MAPSTRRLYVKHRTEFHYDGGARESVNEVRLGPVDGVRQRVEHSQLTIDPGADVATSRDAWGNCVWWFQIPELHDRLEVIAESTVTTLTPDPVSPTLTPAADWAAVDGMEYRNSWAEFLLPSALVGWSDLTREFGASLDANPFDGVAAWGAQLAASLNASLVYERGATDTTTTVDGVIEHGRGVCQDFAHVFVALCRLRGVAAKYISGWLHEPDREGPAESHAWAAIQVPGSGWLEVDPTHPGVVDDRYVRIAVGRDYEDVVPIRGTYLGGATTSMSVEVELIDAGPPPSVAAGDGRHTEGMERERVA